MGIDSFPYLVIAVTIAVFFAPFAICYSYFVIAVAIALFFGPLAIWLFVTHRNKAARAKRILSKRDEWGRENCEALLMGRVKIGMTKEMVCEAFGPPKDGDRQRTLWEYSWVYKDRKEDIPPEIANNYVTFRDDEVTGVVQEQPFESLINRQSEPFPKILAVHIGWMGALALVLVFFTIFNLGDSFGPATQVGKEMTTLLTCQRLEPSLPVTCETQDKTFELRAATLTRGSRPSIQLKTDEGNINLADCSRLHLTFSECVEAKDAINNFIENFEKDVPDVFGEMNIKIKDGRLTHEGYVRIVYKTTPKPTETVSPESYKLATTLTCQRIEPSLPMICETQTDSYELRGATVKVSLQDKTFWVLLETDKGDINLTECNNVAECYEVSDTIISFVENPEESASYVLGESILTIENGRLTYEE